MVADDINDSLADEEDGDLRYLFHTTTYSAAEQIADDGLVPRAGHGVFRHGGYDLHSMGKIFASEGGGALEWFGKVQDQLEHHDSESSDLDERIAANVPVMLRIDLDAVEEVPTLDELGSRDVRGGLSYFFVEAIEPDAIEFWHPRKQEWISMDEALPDARLGVKDIEYYDDDGDPIDEDDWDGESPPGIETFGPYENGGFKPHHES